VPAVPTAGPIALLVHALEGEARAIAGADIPVVELSPPAQAEHGDLATPIALALARLAKRSPREIAEDLRERLLANSEVGALIASAEVAGPGFLNLTLVPGWFAGAAAAVAGSDDFGAGTAQPAEQILLEFVSANPTGLLHVCHARQAAYGDSLARILAFAGHKVDREYYVNDFGRQMDLFGQSVAARYGQLSGMAVDVPDEGYRGDDVAEVARRIHEEVGGRFPQPMEAEALEFFRARGCEIMLDLIRADLAAFRVTFDRFFPESTLHEAGAVTGGVKALEKSGDAYRSEGALWFRATNYGDEKDRVLVRSDGDTTYLASDVAYHLHKAGRGEQRLIDVLGADHHGYIARLKAVLAAGGYDPARLEVSILQLVSLVEHGEAKRMSKRAGTSVTLSELVNDIGVDAARFFLVERSHETAFDLDLDLAREKSQENPVYYVQYAHARVAGILEQVGADAPAAAAAPAELDPSERALVLRLCLWPEAAATAAERRAPHRVAAYLEELAGDFHRFYHRCRVSGEAPEVQAFRLDVCRATAAVIKRGLDLLGVEAPDRM
jgi:arginyl-tRNA synthetase